MDTNKGKKVLIVTYYWPPAGGPGVQRWLKFVKYLPEFGIHPVVYIPESAHYPLIDEGLRREVPENLTVISRPIFEPYQWASVFSKKGTRSMSRGLINEKKQGIAERLLLWIRGNLFIPDARKFWVKPSVSYLEHILETQQIDTVITTGPPHSVHLIGLELRKRLGVRWIADFRDPWTTIGYHQKLKLTGWASRKHKELEKKVLRIADAVIATSRTTASEFEAIAGREVITITNGFDEADRTNEAPSEKFCLAHIGSLLTGRDPKILWEVLAELTEENKRFKEDLRLKLVGAVSEEVLQSVKAAGLEAFLELHGYVAHEEALALQKEARVLLLLEINKEETRGIIPGKLFEYMAARRPIIAIGPEGWEAGVLLEESGAGKVFGYSDRDNLKQTLTDWYEGFLFDKVEPQDTNLNKFTRRALTAGLAQVILNRDGDR